ncbi:MAG TPA: hypothetical protein IAC98_00080 [Candidatus Cryptobacteroides pullicola]|nr:hypothetical protein [Candidatus Cryptobacteroides pullicola]
MLGRKPELFGTYDYIDYQTYIGQMTPEELETVWDGQEHDWFDEVFAPSWSQQHFVTFSGGNNKGHFFTSLNYVNNDGIVKGDRDTYNRLSAQINADYQLFKWLQVGTNTSFEKWATNSVSVASYGSALNSVMSIDPLTPAYYSSIEDCAPDMISQYYNNPDLIYRDPNHNNDFYATSKYLSEATGNPLFQRDRTQSSNGGITVRGTMFANLTPFKGFTFTSRFGYRISQSSSHRYERPYYITEISSSPNYSISANVNTSYYYQWENFANYNRTFGRHNIGAMVGMSYIENNSDNASISSSGTNILQSYEDPFLYINYLLDDRLTFAMDWYRKTTKDLLVQIAPVPEIGVKNTYVNAGDVLNTGLEFELGWQDEDFATLANQGMDVPVLYDKMTRMPQDGDENVRWQYDSEENSRFYIVDTHEAYDDMATVGFKTGKHELFPFPYTVTSINPNITQNPGWTN